MNSKFKQAIAFLAAAAAMTSCVDDLNLVGQSQNKYEEVYFTASIAEQDFFGMRYAANTRSAVGEQMRVKSGFYDLPIDGRNDLMLSVATLDGMFGKATPIPELGKENATTRGMLLTELQQQPMSVLEVSKLSDGKKVAGEPYTAYTVDGATWGGSHIEHNSNTVSRTLYAVYPSTERYTINGATRTLSYTIPEDATLQSDLLYATKELTLGAENKDSVHLTFNHLLTAVRFKIGSQQLPMSVIKSISINGIITSGTYNFTNNTWYLSSDKGKATCNLDFNVTGVENTIINGGESTFMLLPQQLTPTARVTIVYEDYTEGDAESQGTKTLTASLATADTPAWEAGQCITYTLMDHDEKNEYILDVEMPRDFSPSGGTQAVNVLSYRQVEGVRTPMRWIVQSYSSDGGKTWMSGGATNVPKGMSIIPTEGTSVNATPIKVTLFAADNISAPHREFLRYKTPLGNGGEAFDLSRHNYKNEPCAQTTANCYVIDAPGKYRIPTAYGNAIVDGLINSDAYTDKSGYENSTKKNFMTHIGREITAPMIRNNGITLSRATLVWEDVQNLIDPNSIKLVDDGNAIEFEILADNIDQGNAVIAAMDGNNVAWSWHIWVTDEKANLAKPISDGKVDFMPLTLGWCSTADASGAIGREAAVRITMPQYPAKRSSFCIRQNSSEVRDLGDNIAGNATYYNWGRKDPFPGAESTYRTVASSENVSASPKPFYQAGADAAGLGMHAELHVEYSANWTDLFFQGAIVGIKGFLTGVSIGKMINYYKALNTTANTIQFNGHTYRIDLKRPVNMSNCQVEKVPDKIEAMNSLIDKSTKTFTEDFFEKTQACRRFFEKAEVMKLDKVGDCIAVSTNDGHLTNIIRARDIWIDPWGEGDNVFGFEWISVYELQDDEIVYSLTLGDFTATMLASTGQALATGFDFGKVLSNAAVFKGGTDWCREIDSHGVALNYGILHPNVLMRDPISWVSYDGIGNLWNAAQTKYDNKDEKVVKTIYDPCPAGYCVPSAKDVSHLNDETTYVGVIGSTIREISANNKLVFPALGYRGFWDMAEPGSATTNNINDLIMANGSQGMFWTASPAINHDKQGEKGAYALNFRFSSSYDYSGEKDGVVLTPRVRNDIKLQTSYALPIRPVRERK